MKTKPKMRATTAKITKLKDLKLTHQLQFQFIKTKESKTTLSYAILISHKIVTVWFGTHLRRVPDEKGFMIGSVVKLWGLAQSDPISHRIKSARKINQMNHEFLVPILPVKEQYMDSPNPKLEIRNY